MTQVLVDPDEFVDMLQAQYDAAERISEGLSESIEILTILMKHEKFTEAYLMSYSKLITKLALMSDVIAVSGVVTGNMLKEFMPDKDDDG
jgi:hypothetical protein